MDKLKALEAAVGQIKDKEEIIGNQTRVKLSLIHI